MDLYEYLLSKKGVRISEVITIFAPKIMEAKEWAEFDTFDSAYSDIRTMIIARIQNAVEKKNVPGKIKYIESTTYCDEFGVPELEVDVVNSYVRTSNVINWAVSSGYLQTGAKAGEGFALSVTGTTEQKVVVEPEKFSVAPKEEGEAALDDDKLSDMPWLKKKVKELTNEKDKWDRSIAAATKVGLLFYEKELQAPTSVKEFKESFAAEFKDIPGTTIEKIFKNLPRNYRNTGIRPVKEATRIDDEVIDQVIEASVAAGYIASVEEVKDAKQLQQEMTRYEFEPPPQLYIKAISGACKRVRKKILNT